jgi:hypothetical protein
MVSSIGPNGWKPALYGVPFRRYGTTVPPRSPTHRTFLAESHAKPPARFGVVKRGVNVLVTGSQVPTC